MGFSAMRLSKIAMESQPAHQAMFLAISTPPGNK